MSAVFQLAPLYLVAIELSLTTTLMLKLQRPLVAVESGEEWEGFAGWKLQAFKRKKKSLRCIPKATVTTEKTDPIQQPRKTYSSANP